MKRWKIAWPLIVTGTVALASTVRAENGSADAWWNALAVDRGNQVADVTFPDDLSWMSAPVDVSWMLREDTRPFDGPWLLASSVIDNTAPPNRGSDSRRANTIGRSLREPTDPDSPSLPAGSSLESPWDAWENQADSRGEWESLVPQDR